MKQWILIDFNGYVMDDSMAVSCMFDACLVVEHMDGCLMHVEWILMDVSRYLLDSGGFLLPGSGLVKRPDPLALKLVTVECLGQHQSFALKIGSQELIPWTLDGQRAVCPG